MSLGQIGLLHGGSKAIFSFIGVLLQVQSQVVTTNAGLHLLSLGLYRGFAYVAMHHKW